MQTLATIMRPNSLDDFIGQDHLVGSNAPIRSLILGQKICSMIFWGPPASGKTTLAEIIAHYINADFLRLSAVMDGKEELRKILKKAQQNAESLRQTILVINEIHRWSKAQQDALLPAVESGEIILIGATTENPSFTVISALLSRTRVFTFNQHSQEDIKKALQKGVDFLGIKVQQEALDFLSQVSNGDMRFALNSLEISAQIVSLGGEKSKTVFKKDIENAIQKHLRYDKNGEEHYNLISVVHKSLRSGNASASAYWVVRMLAGGEDPLYIARRLIRFASEDIGNAHPTALLMANAVFDTCQKLGMPECEVALVQLCHYLANCKKSNSAYLAQMKIREDVQRSGNLPVPMHFRNAPTRLMKDSGYGKGYEYDHDLKNKKSSQQCMPDELKGREYF